MKIYLIIIFLMNITNTFGATPKSNSRKAIRKALRDADPCKLNLSWGHGAAPRVESDLNRKNIKGRSIFQGCGVGAHGDIRIRLSSFIIYLELPNENYENGDNSIFFI